MSLEDTVTRLARRTGDRLRKTAATTATIGILGTAILTGCHEEPTPDPPDPEPDSTEQTYTLSATAQGDKQGKTPRDGTTFYFTEQESDDTLTTTLNDATASLDVKTYDENVTGTAGLEETTGFKPTTTQLTLTGDTSITLTTETKNFPATINLNTTYTEKNQEQPASHIKYTINDTITDTTNTKGHGQTTILKTTGPHNTPQDQEVAVHLESTNQSNITTEPKNYTKNLTADTDTATWTFNLTRPTYDHTLDGKVTSNLPGKTIADGTNIKLRIDSEDDTIKTTLQDENYNLTTTLHQPEATYKLIINDAPGHADTTLTGTSTGSTTLDVTLRGLTYNATIPLKIENNEEQAISGATIEHETGTAETGPKGEATIKKENLETDKHNKPFKEYTTNTTTKHPDYQQQKKNITYTEKSNPTTTITLEEKLNEFQLRGSTTPNNGVTVTAWLDGRTLLQGTSEEGTYTTNTHDTTATEITTDSTTAKAEGYQTITETNVTLTQGTTTKDYNLPEIKEFWLHGTTTPDNVEVTGWKDGNKAIQGSTTNGNYETTQTKSTDDTIQLDSTTYTTNHPDHNDTTITNLTLQGDGTRKDITLPEKTKEYNENTVFANQTADEYDDGLTFIIKTLSDGQEHQTNVNNNEQVQQLTLEGPYQPTDSIELYYTPTSAATQGKEAKVLTVTRSYEQPTASNGNRNTTLTTTIGDLFNQTPDTTWILSLETNLYDNEAFKTHVGIGAEWNYSENGQRTMTINAITRKLDLGTGTYGDTLTQEELQYLRDRTQLFNQEFWNRGTGLKILNVDLEEPDSYQTSAGNINICYDPTDPQPGASTSQKETTRPYTYDSGLGHAPDMIQAITEETIQATLPIGDYNGSIQDIYGVDQNDKPFIEWEDPLIVYSTYIGGKGP